MNKKQKFTLLRIIVSAVVTLASCFLPLDEYTSFALFAASYLIIGCDVIYAAVRNILNGQIFDEMFLMTVATLGAFAIKKYPEAASVMIFYQVGELFQSIAVGKSRKSIAALMNIRPDFAVVVRDEAEVSVPPEEVSPGEIIIVRPGDIIPLDGEIIDGATAVNTSALTGESIPSDKSVGDKVISGSVNLSGVIRVCTESAYSGSTVAKILELVESSALKKARVENFITRFARRYTPCVVIFAVLLAIVPPLLLSQPWEMWVKRALIFLVVSCPCALVVSVPLSFFGAIGGASRRGILIKGSNYLEALSRVDTVVFDKTGTLTKGTFSVNAVHPESRTEYELLDIAAAAEAHSAHPVAESIIAAHKEHINTSRIGKTEEVPGQGIVSVIDNITYCVGNGKLMDSVGAEWHDCHLPGTVIHISEGSVYLGHIVINDEVKPEAAECLAKLKTMGIKKTVMLTGDTRKAANAVAESVCVDEFFSDLLPSQKVTAVEELISQGRRTAFVGDGINDAPVLSSADVGVAMGALGSDAAIESADIVLMDDDLMKLTEAIVTARKTMRIVNQNITLALSVKAAFLILGALGIADMWTAVFGDVGIMVLAVLNSLRTMNPATSKRRRGG